MMEGMDDLPPDNGTNIKTEMDEDKALLGSEDDDLGPSSSSTVNTELVPSPGHCEAVDLGQNTFSQGSDYGCGNLEGDGRIQVITTLGLKTFGRGEGVVLRSGIDEQWHLGLSPASGGEGKISTIITATPSRYAIYVGNLTWWTTPADIRSAFELLGIRDVLDIKTFEYRCNGQSKGYCLVILGSLESMQLAKAQLYKTEIHGNMPVIKQDIKASALYFELMCKSRPTPLSAVTSGGESSQVSAVVPEYASSPNIVLVGEPTPHVGSRYPLVPPNQRGVWRGAGAPRTSYSRQWAITNFNFNSPNTRYQPPRMPGVPPPPRYQAPSASSYEAWRAPQTYVTHNPNFSSRFSATTYEFGNNTPNPWTQPVPSHSYAMGYSGTSSSTITRPSVPRGFPIVSASSYEITAAPGPNKASSVGKEGDAKQNGKDQYQPHTLTYEEVMEKNTILTSHAIKRAVGDASNGEYGDAIETLVTAISLIRESRVAKDARCHTLISSLEQSLYGIEDRSYGQQPSDHSGYNDRQSRRREGLYSSGSSTGSGGRSRRRSEDERDARDSKSGRKYGGGEDSNGF